MPTPGLPITHFARAGPFPARETSQCCPPPASKPSLGRREVNVTCRAANGQLGGVLQGQEKTCAWKQKAGLLQEPENNSKTREGRWVVTHQCHLSLGLMSLISSRKCTLQEAFWQSNSIQQLSLSLQPYFFTFLEQSQGIMALGLLLFGCHEPGGAEGQGWRRWLLSTDHQQL